MNWTKIPWCDYTWTPVTGCSRASEGCDNCYAAAMARRFHRPWGQPVFCASKLSDPYRVKKAGRVFVCSTSDLGHPGVDPAWLHRIAAVMQADTRHTYMVLTKRPGLWLRQLPEECWVGVSIESQAHINRWTLLRNVTRPNTVRFVSIEPMLGPVSFKREGIVCFPDWVIAGPETGSKSRPCDPLWMLDLGKECEFNEIPFFDKRDAFSVRQFPEVKP